jgi:polyphosphate kinase
LNTVVETSSSTDRHLFVNRELSWLAFNERVLAEVRNSGLPLHERLKFQAIVSGNLDEFFMVRVAGIKQQLQGGVSDLPADGMLPGDQLSAIAERTHKMVEEQYRVWQRELLPLLAANGFTVVGRDALTPEQKAAAKTWFQSNVFPALTPLAVDPGHPFPHLRNKSLNLALVVRRGGQRRRKELGESSLAVVQVPSVLPRLVPMPSATGTAFLLLEELISLYASDLFPGFAVEQACPFRLTRNWDLDIEDRKSVG